MKFTAIILFVACLQVSARGDAQTVSITVSNASLEKVFQEIKKQTGYNFFYEAKVLDDASKVSVSVKNASLEQVLDICFKNQPLTYAIIEKTILVKKRETSTKGPNDLSIIVPPIDIKGRIVDENGRPIVATVMVKGTSKGTTTNDNGEFELKGVDDNAMLVISGVSIETFEVKVNGKSELATLTAKIKVIEGEVVMVKYNSGYQEIPKERATGSFDFIDNKGLNQQVGTNILKRLDGVSSGLYFNIGKHNNNSQNNTNISIRGLSTINGPLDPLIVLDGFVYEGDIDNINPNDVESVTILKDAAASSIWGARAGNGVIVITTKKASFNQKLSVGFNANVIVNTKPDFSGLHYMSSPDYIEAEQYLFNHGYFDNQISREPYTALTPAVDIFLKARNGIINSSDSLREINQFKGIDDQKEYLKYFYTNQVTQQYSVNFKGGSNNNSYLFSSAFDKSLGETYSKTQKINLHFNDQYRIAKRLLLGTEFYYTNNTSRSGRSASYNSILINGRQVPYLKFADDQDNPLPVYTSLSKDYIDTAGAGKLLNWQYVPLENYKYSRTKNNLQELFATGSLKYHLADGLDFDFSYQYQKQENLLELLNEIDSYNARSLINLFSQLDRTTGVVKYIVPKGAIREMDNSSVESNTLRGQINYLKSFKSYMIAAIAGAEKRQMVSEGQSFTAYGYNSDPLTTTSVDFVNPYPTFITGSYDYISGSPVFAKVVNRFVSYYANASISFNQRYVLSGSMRRDGSNIFGANTNDKWKPLWSIGGLWILSEEPFYHSSILPNLKLRVTYGQSGNVDPSRSAKAVATYFPGSSGSNLPYARIRTLNNPDLKWEQVSTLNFGVEFSLIKNIVSGSFEYYIKKGFDLYGAAHYDYTTWGASGTIIKNVAAMKSNGVDVTLSSINLRGKMGWTTNFNFSYNRSITTKYDADQAKYLTSIIGGGSAISPTIGKPLYAIAAYKWGGLDQYGNPQGFLNNQLSTDYLSIFDDVAVNKSSGSVVYVGPATPTFFGSLINTFTWKSISLSFNIAYKFKYYFIKPGFTSSAFIANGIGYDDYSKRWQHPGDEKITNVPAYQYPTDENRDIFYASSEVNVLKGDNLRLNYINLDYSFTKKQFPKLPINNLQVYINAANLGIVWRANKEKFDPDYTYIIPPSKSLALGIRANF